MTGYTSIAIYPLMKGGGQENGLRSGTTNTPGLAGLPVALEHLHHDATSIRELRDRFELELLSRFPDAAIHSRGQPRLPNTSCFSLPVMNASEIVEALAIRRVIVGTGAACSSGALSPSATLLAMGVNYRLAQAALRVSLSVRNTLNEKLSL